MNVYRLNPDGEHFQSLVLKNRDDWSLVSAIVEGRNPLSEWLPFEVSVLRDPKIASPELPPGDFPFLSPLDVFSARAVKALADILGQNGALLPLRCDEGEYFVFVATNVIDAFDLSRSKAWELDTGRVVRIEEYAFEPEALNDQVLFRLVQRPWCETYVTDAFVDRVRSADLIGFQFPLLWTKMHK